MSVQTAASVPQPSSRPPVTLGQTTHLDPGAYVRGTHAITIGEQTLVHPRAQLVAVHGPLLISDKCIISEKCVIGGPIPTTSSVADPSSRATSNPPTPLLEQAGDDEQDPVKTTIHGSVHVHPSAHIHAGATIAEGVLIEAHATVLAGVTIGAHSKVCAGIVVKQDIEPWMVLLGNGTTKRRRKLAAKTASELDDPAELIEALRLKAMDKEREGTIMLLRTASRATVLAKKK